MHRFLVTALLLLAFPTNAGAGSFADFNKGIAAHDRGEIDLSISAFSDALAAGDLSADTQSVAHLDRGNAYAHKKQWPEAIADFDAVLKLKPNNREAYSARAGANIALGNSDAAKRDLLAAAEIVPNDYSFWFALGRFEWQTQDYETALPHLERAVFLDPKNTYAVLWAEIARQSVHRPDTDRLAKQAVLTDLDFWPGPIAEFYRGKTSLDELLRKAADGKGEVQSGQICETNFYVGAWQAMQGQVAQALPLLEDAVTKCPKTFIEYPPAVALLGQLKSAHPAGVAAQ